jgi:ADP-ribose pyrophosphatase
VRSDGYVDEAREPSFLRLRSVTVCIERSGCTSEEGTWDFVERPGGLDAVVVVVYRRGPAGIEVLLRRGLRVPLVVGRDPAPGARHRVEPIEELVAGLIEPQDKGEAAWRERARIEVEEETGLRVPLDVVRPLGSPSWATPGLCAEVLRWYAADATGVPEAPPEGDGSPFEQIVEVSWLPLDEALRRVTREDAIGDMRAELGLRRLADDLERRGAR